MERQNTMAVTKRLTPWLEEFGESRQEIRKWSLALG